MLGLSFLAPGNLFFLALAGLPLLIHLLSRRRWRVLKWAAMEFLLRAMRKQKRRMRLENLLLILLRTAAILCVVLAAAQPVGKGERLPLTKPAGVCWIAALDTSYSMAFQQVGESCLGRAVELAKGRIGELTESDRIVIIAASQFADVVFNERGTQQARIRARDYLDVLEVTAFPLNVGALLKSVQEAARQGSEEGLPVAVEIYTDLQARDWFVAGRKPRPEIREALATLTALGADVRVVDVGAAQRVNLGILQLELNRSLVATDVPVSVQAVVRNWSAQEVSDVAVDLLVDGNQKLGRQLRLPGGATRAVSFRQIFREPGVHTVTVEIRSDGLVQDNRRYLAVAVRRAVSVLLVDGESAPEARDRETFYLEAALKRDGGQSLEAYSPFQPVVVPLAALGLEHLRSADAVVFADCDRLGEVEALKSFVAKGGALLFFLGPKVDLRFYTNELFASPGGLCPLQLRGVGGDPTKRFAVRMEVVALDHPVMQYFAEREDVRLDSAPVWQFVRSRPGKGAKVLAVYRDPERTPAIVESSAGKGKVVVITTTASEKWTNLPKWPDYVPLVHELLSYLVSERTTERNLLVGWPFRRRYPPNAYAAEVRVRAPRSGVTSTSLRPGGSEGDFLLLYEKTSESGLYEVRLLRHREVDPAVQERFPSREVFAVNVVPEEGDLTRASEASLRAAYGPDMPEVVVPGEVAVQVKKEAGPARQDLWRPLLYAMILFFAAEALCAALLGRRQR